MSAITVSCSIAMPDNRDELFYEMRDCLDEGAFGNLSCCIEEKGITIDFRGGNCESLVERAAETLNVEGLKFCIEKGTDKDLLGHAGTYLFDHYDKNKSLVIELIDMIIENDGDIWHLYHRSLIWDCIPIHKHLLTNWKHKLKGLYDLFFDAITMTCAFGHYETVKQAFEMNCYKDYKGSQLLNECLCCTVLIDTFCDPERYKLIKYLVHVKKATLKRKRMNVVNYILSHYSENSTYEEKIALGILRKLFKNHLLLNNVSV